MTFGNFREKIGTHASNTLVARDGEIVYSLKGRDRLRAASFSLPILVGGGGADTYISTPNSLTVIMDNGSSNNDKLLLKTGDVNSLFLAEVDNRHLFAFNDSSFEDILLIDWRQSRNRIETFQFPGETLSFGDVENNFRRHSGYLGNFSSSELGFDDLFGIPMGQAVRLVKHRANGLENGVHLNGSNGNDVLHGSRWHDRLRGRAGHDRLFGHGGHDTLYGGTGQDTLVAGSGHDFLAGNAGRDRLKGNQGKDCLKGGSGRDTLLGESGDDVLLGNSGGDRMLGGRGRDLLEGGIGLDTLKGGQGQDILIGGLQRDILTGGAGVNTFVWKTLQESTLNHLDRITDLAVSSDILDAPTPVAAADVLQLGNAAGLDESSIQDLFAMGSVSANTAATFTVGSRTFLALNDAGAAYSAANDGLVEITGYSGNLSDLQIV